jgi:hypothetical protein
MKDETMTNGMIDEEKFMLAQAAFMSAPRQMNGATLCAFIAAIALDFANDDLGEAQLIIEGSKHMAEMLKAVD